MSIDEEIDREAEKEALRQLNSDFVYDLALSEGNTSLVDYMELFVLFPKKIRDEVLPLTVRQLVDMYERDQE